MPLKGLNKRLHNITFHTHTVSGITISFALFVIFFTGAFALFRTEIHQWENPTARHERPQNIDIDRAISETIKAFPEIDPRADLSVALPTDHNPSLIVRGRLKNAKTRTDIVSSIVNTSDYSVAAYDNNKTTVAETLYALHFFRQIPYVGMYIAGFVALFFLFATVTGVLIHWKDMVKKFFALRYQSVRKQFWKDAHVTFSFIGLPFQLVYGITGALIGLSVLILLPAVALLFDGDQGKARGVLDPYYNVALPVDTTLRTNTVSINDIYKSVHDTYPGHETKFLRIRYFAQRDGVIAINLDNHTLTGNGVAVASLDTGEILETNLGEAKSYNNVVFNLLIKLHYATFGGIWIKWIYFLMSILTCFILVSGILLWQAARDNKKYTEKQRKFHARTTNVFLSICYSLFPATAILFLANKLVEWNLDHRVFYVQSAFFIGWLLLTLSGLFIKSNRALFRYFLLLGGICSLLVPVSNGLVTGDWFWQTMGRNQWYVAGVDLFWLLTGLSALLIYFYRPKPDSKILQTSTI